jgi:hypothetical protein
MHLPGAVSILTTFGYLFLSLIGCLYDYASHLENKLGKTDVSGFMPASCVKCMHPSGTDMMDGVISDGHNHSET